MSLNLIRSILISVSIALQSVAPALALANSAPQAAELKTMSPAELANALRAMNPAERTALLASYRTYLRGLDSALAKSEVLLHDDPALVIEIKRVFGSGFAIFAGGTAMIVPCLYTVGNQSAIIRGIGDMMYEGAKKTLAVGLVLIGSSAVIGATSIALDQVQIFALRKSIKKIQAQIVVIEALTASN
jgi:hypothetical protein